MKAFRQLALDFLDRGANRCSVRPHMLDQLKIAVAGITALAAGLGTFGKLFEQLGLVPGGLLTSALTLFAAVFCIAVVGAKTVAAESVLVLPGSPEKPPLEYSIPQIPRHVAKTAAAILVLGVLPLSLVGLWRGDGPLISVIAGQVSERSAGKPLAGVTVQVFARDGEEIPISSFLSDDSGRFFAQIDGGVPAHSTLALSRPGCGTVSRRLHHGTHRDDGGRWFDIELGCEAM